MKVGKTGKWLPGLSCSGRMYTAGYQRTILQIFLKDYSAAEGPTERCSSELCVLAEGVEDVISGNEVG